jgi:hypothetical protein
MCKEHHLQMVKIQSLQGLIPDNCLKEAISPNYYKLNLEGYAFVDACLVDLIEKLNKDGYPTASCCCGHGKRNAFIYPKKIRQFKKYLQKNSKLFKKTRKVRIPKYFNNDSGKILRDGRICMTFDAIK